MKGFMFGAACAGFLFALAGGLWAQNAGASTTAVMLPDGTMQKMGSHAAFLVFEGESDLRSSQLDALTQIRGLLAGNPAKFPSSDRPAVYDALSAIAMSGTGRPAISGTAVINDYPLIRMQACEELGALGGKQAVTVLLRVMREDSDPFVLAEAAYQLGQLKQDNHNVVSNAIVGALRRMPGRSQDGVFAYSALVALSQLAKTHKGRINQGVYSAIQDIGQMGYGARVAKEAARALQSVLAYG